MSRVAPAPEGPEHTVAVGRRVVLGMLGVGALGVVAGAPLGRVLSSWLAPLQNHDPTGLSSLIPGAGGWRFYSVTATEPSLSPSNVAVSVTGLVNRPTTLTFDALAALPQTQEQHDFQCVTGWRVPAVSWQGVDLRDVLDHVGVQPTARALRFTSADGVYTESLTLEQARSGGVLVATHMQGQVVTQAHGGPVRLYVPLMYGYKSLKWLSGIEVTDQVDPGYWEVRGYDVNAYVGSSNGRTDAPIT